MQDKGKPGMSNIAHDINNQHADVGKEKTSGQKQMNVRTPNSLGTKDTRRPEVGAHIHKLHKGGEDQTT